MGKRNSHIMKISQQDFTHEPHVFPNFSIVPFFVKRRRIIVTVCFSFLFINSNMLELRNFPDVSIPQHLLKFSIYWKFKWVSGLIVFFRGFFVDFSRVSDFFLHRNKFFFSPILITSSFIRFHTWSWSKTADVIFTLFL